MATAILRGVSPGRRANHFEAAVSPVHSRPRSTACAALITLVVLGTLGAAGAAAAKPKRKPRPSPIVARALAGPSAQIRALGGVALAPDGSGGLVYVASSRGVDHVFAAEYRHGAWHAPLAIDAALGAPASQAVIAAANNGRLAVAFVSGGNLYASVLASAGASFGAPKLIAARASNPSIGISQDGVGYLAYTERNANGTTDVGAARVDRTATTFAALGQPVDANPAGLPGATPQTRPQIAVSSDSQAVVTWGDTRRRSTHVLVRRLYDHAVAPDGPYDVTLAGGPANDPQVGIQDDSSYVWIAYHQIVSGRPRVVELRLVGTILGPVAGFAGADAPSIAVDGYGDGMLAAQVGSRATIGAALRADAARFSPAQRAGGAGNAGAPQVAQSYNGTGIVVWQQRARPGGAAIHWRVFNFGRLGGEYVALVRPALGRADAADGLGVAADGSGEFLTAFVQARGALKAIEVATLRARGG